MIFRRIKAHVEEENWFAVFLDFMIVVVGVFLGIQIGNWNEARLRETLEAQYLAQLGEDLIGMDEYLVEKIDAAERQAALTSRLLKAASRDPGADEGAVDELIQATEEFVTNGWRTPTLTVFDAAFTDLQSTGNLSLLDDQVRLRINEYYTSLDDRAQSFGVAREWSLPLDSRIVAEHDMFLWERGIRKEHGPFEEERIRESVLAARIDLARLATVYHSNELVTEQDYRELLDETRALYTDIVDSLKG